MGSIVACARNGAVVSRFHHPRRAAKAVSASPVDGTRSRPGGRARPGGAPRTPRSRPFRWRSEAARASSPLAACHQRSATTATPSGFDHGAHAGGECGAARRMRRLFPERGAAASAAAACPERRRRCRRSRRPSTFSGRSTRGTGRPISRSSARASARLGRERAGRAASASERVTRLPVRRVAHPAVLGHALRDRHRPGRGGGGHQHLARRRARAPERFPGVADARAVAGQLGAEQRVRVARDRRAPARP